MKLFLTLQVFKSMQLCLIVINGFFICFFLHFFSSLHLIPHQQLSPSTYNNSPYNPCLRTQFHSSLYMSFFSYLTWLLKIPKRSKINKAHYGSIIRYQGNQMENTKGRKMGKLKDEETFDLMVL